MQWNILKIQHSFQSCQSFRFRTWYIYLRISYSVYILLVCNYTIWICKTCSCAEEKKKKEEAEEALPTLMGKNNKLRTRRLDVLCFVGLGSISIIRATGPGETPGDTCHCNYLQLHPLIAQPPPSLTWLGSPSRCATLKCSNLRSSRLSAPVTSPHHLIASLILAAYLV